MAIFYVARVVLGIAEAGFFPGIVLYLTYWIPAEERARTGALFMMAAPVAIIVGAPVSEAVLSLDGGWGCTAGSGCFCSKGCRRWSSGCVALRVLTDRPGTGDWLPDGDRAWLSRTMNDGARATRARPAMRRICAQPRERPRLAALRGLLPQHDGDLRHLPVAAEDPGGRLRARAASA